MKTGASFYTFSTRWARIFRIFVFIHDSLQSHKHALDTLGKFAKRRLVQRNIEDCNDTTAPAVLSLLRGRSLFVRCLRFTESKSSSLISLYLKRTKHLHTASCVRCVYVHTEIYSPILKRQNIFAQSKYILIHYTEPVQYLAYRAYISTIQHMQSMNRDFKNIIFWPDS